MTFSTLQVMARGPPVYAVVLRDFTFIVALTFFYSAMVGRYANKPKDDILCNGHIHDHKPLA